MDYYYVIILLIVMLFYAWRYHHRKKMFYRCMVAFDEHKGDIQQYLQVMSLDANRQFFQDYLQDIMPCCQHFCIVNVRENGWFKTFGDIPSVSVPVRTLNMMKRYAIIYKMLGGISGCFVLKRLEYYPNAYLVLDMKA